MRNKTAGGGSKFSASLIIGLLLVPLSAVAAVALVTPDASADPETTAAVAPTVVDSTTTSAAVAEVVAQEIASADDLAAACGDEGMDLVTREAEGVLSPLEQAALDSLRAICATEGMELPGKPASEPIVETVTVVAASSGGGSAPTSDSSSNELAEKFEEKYAQTVAYINNAINKGAQGSMVDLATQFVADAAALADSGDYTGGMAKLDDARNAIDQADYATTTRHDDDDDDEDDDDDHDEDHDDDHDDDHDEDDD